LIGHLGTRLFVGACEPVQNREPIRYLYIPDQNLFSPFFGLSSPGAARPSGLGFLAGRGRLWHVIGVAAQDGDVLGCAVRWGGLQPDPPFRPSEFKRVQELLSTIERASNALKDELVNVRARGDVKKKKAGDDVWRDAIPSQTAIAEKVSAVTTTDRRNVIKKKSWKEVFAEDAQDGDE